MNPFPSGLFITGTDTGIGKTVLTGCLLRLLRERGVDAVPMKPVQTGSRDFTPGGELSDLDTCFHLAGVPCPENERPLLNPFVYPRPCSPHLAAEDVGELVDPEHILQAWRALHRVHDTVLAEGAGGLLVPLTRDGVLTADLIARLEAPVLVAARPDLGTLNHTLLTLAELRRRAIPIAGVVLIRSTTAPPSDLEEDNRRTLRELGAVPVLGPLPWLADPASDEAADIARTHLAPLLEITPPQTKDPVP